ncbi:MAG: 16S rRNA (guanine(527)-N(7))-methyltransferase RsmG [Proteobacteria bacterium]|nr:16S rRNA (guanine(527)-N(7))-methyltransferase RsmG [Pseudomonadota bacterium]
MTSTAPSLDHLRPALAAGLAALRLPGEPLAARLLAYLDLLLRWNAAYNLTAIREPAQMVRLHLLDSLSIVPFVGGALADIGSGAGLPGIPLALAVPGLQVTSIESAGKKARFQRQAQRELGLDNFTVVAARAEAFAPERRFDCLVSRAFGSLAQFVRVGGHLLAPGGQLLAMKGADPAAEVAALPAGWQVTAMHALDVPGLDARRHLLVIERDGDTTQGDETA